MSDVDILVPTDRALAAIPLLRELGWDSIDYPDPERMIELRHAEGFRRRADGALIDLHWNALMQPFRDDDLWSDAIDIEIGGVPTRAPCATDQLLLVVVHSLLHGEFPGSLLWITDSAALLGPAGQDIVWDRLVDAARRREVTVPLVAGLGYLQGLLGIVPEAVISELAGSPTRPLERAAFHAAGNGGGHRKKLTLIADRHARLRRLDTPFPRPDLLIYLARSLGYPTRRQLLAVGVRTMARDASGRLRRIVRRTALPAD